VGGAARIGELTPKMTGILIASEADCEGIALRIRRRRESSRLDFLIVEPETNSLHRTTERIGLADAHGDDARVVGRHGSLRCRRWAGHAQR
jgi:hypothetical protein